MAQFDLLNKMLITTSKVVIAGSRSRGRGLFATEKILKNDKIFTSYPLAGWMANGCMTNICHMCFRDNSNGATCELCVDKPSLMEDSFKLHQSLSHFQNESAFEPIAAKLAHHLCQEIRRNDKYVYYILNMLAYPEVKDEFRVSHEKPAIALKKQLGSLGYENEVATFLDLDWYTRIMGILHLNSMRTPHPEKIVLFGDISFLNHSCQPTVGLQFDDQSASVVALRDISPGDELFLSYIDGESEAKGWTREEEREYLKFNYGIDCASTCSCEHKIS